jgi:hypothetical protein
MFWKSNKAAQKGGQSFGIRGFFQQVYGVFTAAVIDTDDAACTLLSAIDTEVHVLVSAIVPVQTAPSGIDPEATTEAAAIGVVMTLVSGIDGSEFVLEARIQ